MARARTDDHYEQLRVQPSAAPYRPRQDAGDDPGKGNPQRRLTLICEMSENTSRGHTEQRLKATEERFRIAQIEGGIGWFEWNLMTGAGDGAPPVAPPFGFGPGNPPPTYSVWG